MKERETLKLLPEVKKQCIALKKIIFLSFKQTFFSDFRPASLDF